MDDKRMSGFPATVIWDSSQRNKKKRKITLLINSPHMKSLTVLHKTLLVTYTAIYHHVTRSFQEGNLKKKTKRPSPALILTKHANITVCQGQTQGLEVAFLEGTSAVVMIVLKEYWPFTCECLNSVCDLIRTHGLLLSSICNVIPYKKQFKSLPTSIFLSSWVSFIL